MTAKTSALETQLLVIHAEEASVSKRVRKTLVQAARTSRTKDVEINEGLVHDEVVVERVFVGRIVETPPPVRQEGDVTIMPIVVEELVVTRHLVLKEEVHLRRVRRTEQHVETVTLREQEVTVTRTPVED